MKHQHHPYSIYNLFTAAQITQDPALGNIIQAFKDSPTSKSTTDQGILIDSLNLDYLQAGYMLLLQPLSANIEQQLIVVYKLNLQDIYQAPQLLGHTTILSNSSLDEIKQHLQNFIQEIKVAELVMISKWSFTELRNTNPSFAYHKLRIIEEQQELLNSSIKKLNRVKFLEANLQRSLIGTVTSSHGKDSMALVELLEDLKKQPLKVVNANNYLLILSFIGAFNAATSYNYQRLADIQQQIKDIETSKLLTNYHISYLTIEMLSLISEQLDVLNYTPNDYNQEMLLQLFEWFKATESLLDFINQEQPIAIYQESHPYTIYLFNELSKLSEQDPSTLAPQLLELLQGFMMLSIVVALKSLELMINPK